jgi:predicted ArsR family transcriptional regulator
MSPAKGHKKTGAKGNAFSLRVTSEDDQLLKEAVDKVSELVGEEVARSVVLRRALRRGLRSIIADPRMNDEEKPRRPRS